MAVGNLTIDEIFSRSRHIATAPGGSSFYVAAIAAQLGARTSIVSSIGPDYPVNVLKWLKREKIGLESLGHTGSPTTRFILTYGRGERRLELLNTGDSIRTPDTGKSDVVHLGPVFREVEQKIVAYSRRHSKMVSLDVQGLLRTKGRANSVQLEDRNIDQFLRGCDLVKASEKEARMITRLKNPVEMACSLSKKAAEYAIVSFGANGFVVANRDETWRVPAYPEESAVDSTGAGDALVAGWLEAFWQTKDPKWASAVGAAVSSMVTRRVGLSKFRLSKSTLSQRAAWVYQRIVDRPVSA